MSKRESSDERGDRAAKRPAPQRKQHMYLLLDDWDRGYSVRKLDFDAFDAAAEYDLSPSPFTEPPIARIEAPHVRSWNFVSHGSKIFAMKAKESSPAIPGFDAHTLAHTICPWPSCRADYVIPLFVSVGGKLFLFLEDLTEFLGEPPQHESAAPWSWTTVTTKAPPLPFYNAQVACYAVHPDGRTLFVSAGGGTFSFDAERLAWTRRGDWLLPFDGEAYFDAELDAWVGLCGDDRDNAGRLCSCDVPPVDADELTRPPPSRKLCKDRLFRKEAELHRGAKLVCMGDSKYCLVESMFHKDERHRSRDPTTDDLDDDVPCPRRRRRVVRVTTFGLKYDKAGELQITQRRGHACMTFTRPHDFTERSMEPLAFWL